MNNILVVYKKSAFELYSASPDEKTREFMAQNSKDVKRMKRSHEAQKKTLDVITTELERRNIKYEAIYRADLEDIDRELVIVVGGDGTVLEVSHYVKNTPILGVNSDPGLSIGFFCCYNKDTIPQALENIDDQPRTTLSRLELVLNGQHLPELVLNDVLVAHANPAATSRYKVKANGKEKKYISSGVLVCTPVGSTGWMYQEGGEVMNLSATNLQFINRGVRDAQPQFTDGLEIHYRTREGKIYVDGAHVQHELTLGDDLVVKASSSPITIVGDLEAKRAHY